MSIYVSEDARSGIGTRLYAALEDILKQQNIVNVNACIAFTTPAAFLSTKSWATRQWGILQNADISLEGGGI